MAKKIEVSLEAFGNRRLTRVFEPEELRDKPMEAVVGMMLHGNWDGEDNRTLTVVKKEMGASGGYSLQVGATNGGSAVRFQPVNLGDNVARYVTPHQNMPVETVRIAVLGKHTVGYGFAG
jgi:hypothetical protein